MQLSLKWGTALSLALTLVFAFAILPASLAQDDLVHIVKGVVKSVDKDSKTMVVKTADGTEHTIKWTDKTTMEGAKDTGKGLDKGSRVAVKYTEKGGEKTAVGVKDIGKDAEKAAD